MRRGERGFTLLEVMVALVVIGLLVAGLAEGVRFGLRAWDLQNRMLGRNDGLDAVDRVLSGLITEMQPGAVMQPPRISGSADRLAFVTELPLAAGPAELRTAAVVLTTDASHRLLLDWTPDPHATPLEPSATHRVVLLSGVARLEISYWLPADHGGGWIREWHRPYLPALVRIRILFQAGDRRVWPDIVAAPIRERPEA